MNIGDFEEVEIRYYGQPSIKISKFEIDRMMKAKDAIETIAYALTIAKELNQLNKKREE